MTPPMVLGGVGIAVLVCVWFEAIRIAWRSIQDRPC